MAENNFNKPLLLINKKPNGEQMVMNGYGFYMIPDLVIKYANRVLTDRERRLYYADKPKKIKMASLVVGLLVIIAT